MRIGYFLSCEEFGPRDLVEQARMAQAAGLAARIGDGYCGVTPDADLVDRFRSGGGGTKVAQAGTKVCFGADEDECVKTVHRLWPNEGLGGELPQILPTPAHFEQATQLVTEEMIAGSVSCGPDVDAIVQAFQAFADAGYDELYVQQIGNRQSEFFDVLEREVLPELAS